MGKWVIAGKEDGAKPEVGKVYDIRHSRKGNFTGRVLSVDDNFARVEILEGKIRWASNENRLFNPNPATVGIRDSLCFLTEIPVGENE